MYVAIDSKDRNIKGKNILDNQTYNLFNVINTQNNSNTITINHINNYTDGDKIRLEIVETQFQTLNNHCT